MSFIHEGLRGAQRASVLLGRDADGEAVEFGRDTDLAGQPALFAHVERDTHVKKGQVVGHTTDFLGRPTGTVVAEIDGLVTFIRGVPSMWKGSTLVNILPVLKAPAPWQNPASAR